VVVRAGSYPSQRIGFDRRKRSNEDVVFRAAPGARVIITGYLTVNGRHLELRGLRMTAWRTLGSADDVTFRSVRTSRFLVQGSSNVRMLGGRAGPATNASNLITAASNAARRPSRAIVLDGVTIQGYRRTVTSPSVSCLDVRAADGLTIRNSRLFDCQDFALRFSASRFSGTPTNVVVENNLISCCRTGFRGLRLEGTNNPTWAKFLIRNNSSSGAVEVAPGGTAVDLDVYANIASSFSGCDHEGLAADYNVWETGSPCGANDVVAPSGFADARKYDFELLPGAAAIDIGSPGTNPARDIDGQRRPLGPAPDAGAKESRASGLVAAYPLNELAGSVTSDASAKGNLGVLSGASWTPAGRFGGALSFDGANDWVTVADDPSLDLTNRMTLEAWVKPRALGSVWRTVLMKEQPGGLTYALYGETNSGEPSGSVNVGTELDTRAASELPLDSWTHLAATYDGLALRLFVNGRQVSSRPVSGSLTTSANVLRLGGNGVWDEWLRGVIDEVRVYRRVLSEAEIAKDMSSPIKVAGDNEAPSAPDGLVPTGATSSSISLAWTASTDGVAVAGYGLYRNGTSVGSTVGTSYTFAGLACGQTYTLTVDAYDAAGNRSGQTSVSASTSACPPPDTTAPSPPGAFAATDATQTSISVSWSASADDVGIAGYGLYRNGTSTGSTASTSHTFGGLVCGTTYTLAVDAYDSAGNRSGRASLSASTSGCSPSSGSANLWIDPNGGTCLRDAGHSYADGTACGSFDAANDKCQNGDLVLVKGGTYTDQTVTGSSGRTSACTMQGASGETVDFHTLTTSGNWLTVKDMMSDTGVTEHLGVAGCSWCNTGSNITLDNVDFPGKWAAIEISGGDSVTWKNSELGSPGNTADRLCGRDDEPARMSNATNVVIDHNVFHPFRGEENPANCGGGVYHLETWRLWDSNDGVLFSNNHFDDSNGDDSFTISSSKGGCGGCPDNKNLHFVNNYFGDKCCGYAGADIGFGDGRACTGFVFAYNFFHSGGAGLFNNCSSESGMVYVGNMGYNPGGCPVSGTNTANLWIGTTHGTCAGNTWLSGGPDNWSSYRLSADGLHLTGSSPSVNAGETSLCATWTSRLDIDGQARSGSCDVGPDEHLP
jgi:chitodextrinase